MASFTALNVYPDSDSDSEVDNTQEIQIEEALKIYQRALKAHSEKNWAEAENAYDELFKSEIFEYASSLPLDDEDAAATSSVHSVLYLAFKNHAAFLLDRLKSQSHVDVENPETQKSFEFALLWFSEALARDSGDPALWRNSAQLSQIFNSTRLERFCLESVLDRDATLTEPSQLLRSGQGPVEYISSLQLRDVLVDLTDDTSLSSTFFQRLMKNKAQLLLVQQLIPYPWLKAKIKSRRHGEVVKLLTYDPSVTSEKHMIHVHNRSWSAVGRMLLKRRHMVDDKNAPHYSNYIRLDIPPAREDSPDSLTATEVTPETDQAAADDGDVAMGDAASSQPEKRRDSNNRKRKSTSLAEEPGRARSKRVRERESIASAAATIAAPAPVRAAMSQDERLFSTAETCFSPFAVTLGKLTSLRSKVTGEDAEDASPEDLYLRDFKELLRDWDDDKGNVLLYGVGIQTPDEASPGMAFDTEATSASTQHFPQLDGEGLGRWLRQFDKGSAHVKEMCFEWLKALMMRDWIDPSSRRRHNCALAKDGRASWVRHRWSDALREIAFAMVGDLEDALWNYFKEWQSEFKIRMESTGELVFNDRDYAVVEWAETILEVFLAKLAAADKERSAVDTEELQEQWESMRHKCRRWSYLVGDLIHCRPRNELGELTEDQLTLRYLWVSAEFAGFTDATREFVLECFDDLRKLLRESGIQIMLPNSLVMPEVSAQRAERKISKLKTMDFFTSIFKATTQMDDPAEVIVNLEAILNPKSVLHREDVDAEQILEMARFLEGSSSQFKLYLWERLLQAYEDKDINYPLRVFACRLKCLEIIMGDLRSGYYLESSEENRQFVLLRALHQVEKILPAALDLVVKSRENLSLAEETLVHFMKPMTLLLRLLHTYAFFEDGVLNSEFTASNLHSYRLAVAKFKDMLIQAWCLMYLIYREVLEKTTRELEQEPKYLLGNLLRDIHDVLGVRNYCKLANRQFLKLTQAELFRFNEREFDEDLVQVFSCRFGLRMGTDQWELFEHKADPPEQIDKKHAMEVLDFIFSIASRKKIHQLHRADIRTALEKMVEIIGVPKKSTKLQYNEDIIECYLSSSVHPMRLRDSLKGKGFLSTVPVTGDYAEVAKKGLYFLHGHIHLSMIRDRSFKNRAQIKSDDLDIALRFFKYTLICDAENWEAWYRLAQTFGSQTDEDLAWTADNMNSNRAALVKKERRCILSYIMALATAIRNAEDTPENRKKLSQLYFDFGFRIYSSARPPMSMESWWMDDFIRHYSGTAGQGMYKRAAHKEVDERTALRFAAALFERALEDEAKNWKIHYYLGKCMGKLEKLGKETYTAEDILQRYALAVNCAPDKCGQDILVEPHHKILSAAFKYAITGKIPYERACEIVETSQYTKGLPRASDRESFLPYMLSALQKLRSADRQKWHHRMTNRITRIEQEQREDIPAAVKEIGSLFSQKAANLSIWRPEHERPGRHYVFASRYTLLYVSLLELTGDRATLEIVAKRVRKNSQGLYQHSTVVWESTYRPYAKLLRKAGEIPAVYEDTVFKDVSFDEFNAYTNELENWLSRRMESAEGRQEAQEKWPIVEVFREVMELRKLNMGFGRTVDLDDLVADAFAKLYNDLVPVIRKEAEEWSGPMMGIETDRKTAMPIVASHHSPLAINTNPMSLKNLMSSDDAEQQQHSSTATTTTSSTPTPIHTPANSVIIAAQHGKIDMDLPYRGKMTKVTRRDILSRANGFIKAAPGDKEKKDKEAGQRATSPKADIKKDGKDETVRPKDEQQKREEQEEEEEDEDDEYEDGDEDKKDREREESNGVGDTIVVARTAESGGGQENKEDNDRDDEDGDTPMGDADEAIVDVENEEGGEGSELEGEGGDGEDGDGDREGEVDVEDEDDMMSVE